MQFLLQVTKITPSLKSVSYFRTIHFLNQHLVIMTKFLLVATFATLLACSPTTEDNTEANPPTADTQRTTIQEDKMSETEAIQHATSYRERIESGLEQFTKQTVSLEEAREQVAQKWAKMDVYTDGDAIVRIKTYPHEGISTRTEEFYYENGTLVLAFIEDEGAGAIGKKDGRKGKTYIYNDGNFITERNTTGEAEITEPEADAQRLLQEAKEYLALAK